MSFISRVYGVDRAQAIPYRLKVQLPFGFRLHKFYRADRDRAWHDHPNHFWTYPFTDYVEETLDPATGERQTNIVCAHKWHYRDASHTHRLLGRADEYFQYGRPRWYRSKPHWTFVREVLPEFRPWGFYVEQPDGAYRWIQWRAYLFGGQRS